MNKSVRIAAGMLRFIYGFKRSRKLEKKAVIISRQSDVPTMDISMLRDRMVESGIETTVLCKTLGNGMLEMISYAFHMLKQMSEIATSKVIVLDGYCVLASILPKKEGQSIVQIWHAMGAVKKFGWQSVEKPDGRSPEIAEALNMHGNYDYVLAPCGETGKFFAEAFRMSEDQMVRIGLPRIDYLKTPDEGKRIQIEEKYPEIKEKINVLYVPTFRRNAVIGMEKLIAGFDFEHMNLIVKKHFLDTGDYSWAIEKGAIVDEDFPSFDWLKICQKVVTDYSAIAFEAASIDRELYIFQPDVDKYAKNNGLNMDMYKEAISSYVCRTEEELYEALKKPYDINDMAAFRDKYLDIDLDDCTGQLCRFISTLL